MRNFQTQRRPSPAERYAYVGDENKVAIKVVRVCMLKLDSDFLF